MWNEGYVSEIDYTYGFYRELGPQHIRFALAAAGVEPPPIDAFNYCELGFGQGLGANIIAAANSQGSFWGTDFNPRHAITARQLAGLGGLKNTHWFDDSFEEFLARDLPEMDYVVLHGIHSWISAEHRAQVIRFLRQKMKLGGVVYVSYNTLPGWAPAIPLQALLSQYVDWNTLPGDSLSSRLDAAIKFAGELAALPTGYFNVYPQVTERLKGLDKQNRNYLAHEYLNRHWDPVFFSQMAAEMEGAKLSFAAHANPLNVIDSINHTAELQKILDGIRHPVLRETVRDMAVNQTFRKDLFVRGPRRLGLRGQARILSEQPIALITERQRCALKVSTLVGASELRPEVYEPLLDRLAERPTSAAELISAQPFAGFGLPRLLQAIIVLVGAGYAHPCMPEESRKAAQRSCASLNGEILKRTMESPTSELGFLASPRIGSGVGVDRLQQLFLYALKTRLKASASEVAQVVWQNLASHNLRMTRDGQTLQAEADNLAEIERRFNDWSGTRAMLQQLDIGG